MKSLYDSPELEIIRVDFEQILDDKLTHSFEEVPTVDGDDDLLG